MASLFSKKSFIADLLENFVDIHCHILPGIDDGASNSKVSITLIRKLKKLGIVHYIATPHVMFDYYPNTAYTIAEAYEKLQDALVKTNLSQITVSAAAEYMIDMHFEELLDTKNILPLKGTYVLVEMSYLQPPINLEATLKKIQDKGFLPVLAHPERYVYYHDKKMSYDYLKRLGCFFQANLLSFGPHYGKNVQKTAHYLLENGWIDFVGTDVHHIGHVNSLAELTVSSKTFEHLKPVIANTTRVFSTLI
ncbi:tyrosine-protein phosphatase [Leptobacterium sp. I13]|uniref:tyrosine-protein phosphatase n=1 Tax=Leptobacterium meishanense TaxID=3128904 RepID=UPI0030EF7D4B